MPSMRGGANAPLPQYFNARTKKAEHDVRGEACWPKNRYKQERSSSHNGTQVTAYLWFSVGNTSTYNLEVCSVQWHVAAAMK